MGILFIPVGLSKDAVEPKFSIIIASTVLNRKRREANVTVHKIDGPSNRLFNPTCHSERHTEGAAAYKKALKHEYHPIETHPFRFFPTEHIIGLIKQLKLNEGFLHEGTNRQLLGFTFSSEQD